MHCSSWKREEKCCAGIPTFGMHFSVVTAVTCKANINLDSHVDKNTSEWKMSSRSNGSKLKKNFGEKEIKLHFFFPCLVTSCPFPSCTHFSEQGPHILGNFHKHGTKCSIEKKVIAYAKWNKPKMRLNECNVRRWSKLYGLCALQHAQDRQMSKSTHTLPLHRKT